MDEKRTLVELGKEMGLSGEALVAWVSAEQKEMRDQRAKEREEARIAAQADHERELARMEAERALLEERRRAAEAQRPNMSLVGDGTGGGQSFRSPHKMIPPYNEGRDELDAYIQRFERVASSQGWPTDKWALSLSLCLTGEALTVVGRMSAEDSTDYAKLKQTLLQRFRYTEEGYRVKFRDARPENAETGRQFAGRLLGYFDHWQELAKTSKTYEALRDKMVSEQFIRRCDEKLAIFLKERGCRNLDMLATTADQYLEAQGIVNLAKGKEEKGKSMVTGKVGTTNESKGKLLCFLCNRQGHRAADCWTKSRAPKSPQCWTCKKTGHRSDSCPSDSGKRGEASCSLLGSEKAQHEELVEPGHDKKRVTQGHDICDCTQSNATCDGGSKQMPTAKGYLEGKLVTILRDTGCNTVVVKRSLVPDSKLTGSIRTIRLLDQSTKSLPEAEVCIDSPFFKGQVLAVCMENPLYEVVLGNVTGVLSDTPHIPKPEERPRSALVRTDQVTHQDTSERIISPNRGRKENVSAAVGKEDKQHRELSVPWINPLDISPKELRKLQSTDPTLETCFAALGKKTTSKKSAVIEFVLIRDVLFRRYHTVERRDLEQLVVPKDLRNTVMKMAHEGLLSGHQGQRRTTDRVLEEFYWPGVQADVTRFVKSCDICQRTVPKHLVGRIPLGNMPIIDTPFQRVAVDIIGPLSPTSAKGNRYVLTMVDFATRYPDAVALPSIETERIAEALLEMFSRVGVPREIVSDRGKSFTSNLMQELGRLLSFRQLPTTPYHPMANGLVERFNGTLKQMVRRMCQECPKQWDRYLAPLLFAYREVPQASLGFSPFDLLYGRFVRGPMSILKELWTGDNVDAETKTTYGYVVELQERLQNTCKVAHEELQKAKVIQKKYYDKKTRVRQLSPGDKVLLLLPSDRNKLILTWKGPFTVVEKRNEYDYLVDLGGRMSLFHINLLKKYEERESTADVLQHAAVTVQTDNTEEQEMPFVALHQRETYKNVLVATDLSNEQTVQIDDLLKEFQDVFSDVPGKTNVVECKLRLTTETPVNVRPYPIPFAIQEAVEQEVQDMLKQGIIEPSDSPYQAPIVVVKKKDGSMRLCIDFRQLNRVVVTDNEPIPRVDMMFAKLGQSQYFSKFDFTKGYWQVPMHEASKPLTAFQASSGLYQFRFMPFGIKTAPAVFTRLMRRVVEGIPNIYHYFDDVLIATQTWDEHITTLTKFLKRVRAAHLTIKPSKSEVAFASVKFLGHIVGNNLLRPQIETLEKIQAAKRPQTKKEVRSFLGLTGYYRDFIPNYSAVAAPLTELTKKRGPNKVIWEECHQQAFETLRRVLSSSPVLRSPELQEPFILRTDASSSSVGAVLLQRHDGVLHPVAYASRKLLARETRYSTIEREALALVWAIQKFHVYLFGKRFVLQTDHQPLAYINSAKHMNSRVLRWSLLLTEYDFVVEYIKGAENIGADYLSRV